MLKVTAMLLLFSTICITAWYQFADSTYPTTSQLPEVITGTTNQPEATSLGLNDTNLQTHPDDTSLTLLNDNKTSKVSTAHKLETSDIGAMLANIEDLTALDNGGPLIASQFDLLKNFLLDHPEDLSNAIAQLDDYPVDSVAFKLLVSALQTIPVEGAEQALIELAKHYGMQSDLQSQRKFITLLTSSPSNIESDEIVQSLVDFTLYAQTDLNLKLEALDLLYPLTIRPSEQGLLVIQLHNMITAANSYEAKTLLPHLMHFALEEQRSAIAISLLSYDNEETFRIAVLENVNAGIVPATDSMKDMLLDIANNINDPLSSAAQNTLSQTVEMNN